MRSLRFAMRMLRRDWRAGELRLLIAALVVAVASVTAVGFFTDRIDQALARQAGELLGGDLKISASRPISREVRALAEAFGLSQVETVEFPSMVMSPRTARLASIKAVGPAYPLRGAVLIRTADAPGEARAAPRMPRSGEVWLEPRLLQQLGLRIGGEVILGDTRLRVTAVLVNEPARTSGTLFTLAPRLLFSLSDLPATGLVQPASRVAYAVLLSGPADRISAFRKAAETKLRGGERLTGAEGARPEVRSALDRGGRFLALAALVSVMLAGIAIAMAAWRFTGRRLDDCAIMRCFGATQREILTVYFLELLILAALASLAGCLAGYLAQLGLVGLLGTLVALELPAPSWWPVAAGMLTGLVTVLGFALPALLHIRNVPALRVLRRDLGGLPGHSLSLYGAGVAAFGLLVVWQTGDGAMSAYALAGVAGVLLGLGGAAAVLIRLLRLWQHKLPRAWRLGVMNLTHRAAGSSLQVAAFGVGMTVLLLLSMVRVDLLASWENTLPPDTPNRFLINIQAAQTADLERRLRAIGLEQPGIFPMVRGRLTAIGGEAVTPGRYEDERAQRLVAREFNLSWAAGLQADNEITAGAWWDAGGGTKGLSVEEGLARTLGIGLGDRLDFEVAGSIFSGRVTSLRKVAWDSFRVNFFVIAAPGMLEGYPASYISSLYIPPGRGDDFDAVMRDFPNVTVIDVAAIMEYVRQVMERIVLAVDYVFVFTLLSGLLVLYATIQATLDARIRENAVMRTLGAGRGLLLRALAIEFAGIGLLAGLVASGAATLLGKVLGERVFQLPYGVDPAMILVGTLAGGVGVCIAGYLGTRRVLERPPLQTLMERA